MTIECTACKKPLKNGLDTFGDVNAPLCWDCYSAIAFEPFEHVDLRTLFRDEDTEAQARAAGGES